jgi:tetratricopeptide (TPR) repeat protein
MNNDVDTKTPQQLETEGGNLYRQGDYVEAANIFAAAEEGFEAMGDVLKSAELANNRSVALLQSNQGQAAFDVVKNTIDVFRQVGDERRLAMALGNRAAALEALKEFEQAISDYEESATILKKLGENDLRLDVMKALSGLQLRTGRSMEALVTMQTGVEGVEKPKLSHRLLKRLLKLPFRFLGR